MERIKKKIKQFVKFDTIDGNTSIVPDLNKSYNFNILLTSNQKDLGIFTSSDVDDENIDFGDTDIAISAETRSRLYELQKSNGSYFTSIDISNDGLNNILSNSTKKIYYIDNVEYIDDLINNKTFITYISKGLYDINNFNSKFYHKDDSLIGKTEKPRINKDVFIDRQELSVSEGHYRLTDITTVADFSYYGGGKYFKIKEN